MELVKELDAKYGFGFDRVPCHDATLFFIDGHLQRWLHRLLEYLMEARLLRATIRQVAP